MLSSAIIFEDIFAVKNIDEDGKKFDKVSRINCISEGYEMELILDVNVDIYPLEIDQRFSYALATTLGAEGTLDEAVYDPVPRHSLADSFEYVMQGKVFKYAEEKSKLAVYVSFGGLMMMLKGDPRHLSSLTDLDSRIYLLMRKV